MPTFTPPSTQTQEVPKVLPQVTGVPVHLPSLWASHGPSGLYKDCKSSEADGPDKGNQTSSVPGRLAHQSQEEAQVNAQTVVDLTQSLGWIINEEKFKQKPTQVFSFIGYEYHLDSTLVKPTQVKTCFDCKMFDVINWVACFNGENGPTGTPSHEALSVSPHGALEIFSVVGHPLSLDRNHFSTPRVVAESLKRDERCRPSSKKTTVSNSLTNTSNKGWDAYLEQASTKGLWSDTEKRLHINVLELKAVSLALQRFKNQCQTQCWLLQTAQQ